jgi:glycosyltransferase involved in cell wall biosynthesis
VFLSYYAIENDVRPARLVAPKPGDLRARLRIPASALVVGNINMFYAPKPYLGQLTGVKAHEDVIEALRIVTSARPDVYGVLAGGPWGNAQKYFERMRKRAQGVAPGRILLPGRLAPTAVLSAWGEFDCAVHVPLSENCGGVVEPMLAGVPVIAGRVGGLEEVVIEGITGLTVPIRNPRVLADAILEVLARPAHYRALARVGSHLVDHMFSSRRTGAEIKRIYEYILGYSAQRPEEFDSREFVAAAPENHAQSA